MKVLRNKLQSDTTLKNSGCLLKEEETEKIPNIYYHSRVSDDDFCWKQYRLDKKISKSQLNGSIIPIRYTDVYTYKKNYKTITHSDFVQN